MTASEVALMNGIAIGLVVAGALFVVASCLWVAYVLPDESGPPPPPPEDRA